MSFSFGRNQRSDTILRSHYHWDHLGDPSTFPNSTEVVVGPGFGEEFLPGGQPVPDSPILSKYYENRNLREISNEEFDQKFGTFPAYDYFGDGSFYLIDSPGVRFIPLSSMCLFCCALTDQI